MASGNVVFSSSTYRADADRAEYEEAKRQIKLFGNPVVLADSQNGRQWKRPVFTLSKVGDKIVVNSEEKPRR